MLSLRKLFRTIEKKWLGYLRILLSKLWGVWVRDKHLTDTQKEVQHVKNSLNRHISLDQLHQDFAHAHSLSNPNTKEWPSAALRETTALKLITEFPSLEMIWSLPRQKLLQYVSFLMQGLVIITILSIVQAWELQLSQDLLASYLLFQWHNFQKNLFFCQWLMCMWLCHSCMITDSVF